MGYKIRHLWLRWPSPNVLACLNLNLTQGQYAKDMAQKYGSTVKNLTLTFWPKFFSWFPYMYSNFKFRHASTLGEGHLGQRWRIWDPMGTHNNFFTHWNQVITINWQLDLSKWCHIIGWLALQGNTVTPKDASHLTSSCPTNAATPKDGWLQDFKPVLRKGFD